MWSLVLLLLSVSTVAALTAAVCGAMGTMRCHDNDNVVSTTDTYLNFEDLATVRIYDRVSCVGVDRNTERASQAPFGSPNAPLYHKGRKRPSKYSKIRLTTGRTLYRLRCAHCLREESYQGYADSELAPQ